MDVQRVELADGVRFVADCTITVRRLAPGVLLTSCEGYDGGILAKAVVALWREELARAGQLHVFFDLRKQTGMMSPARDIYASFGREVRDRARGTVLVDSRVLDMIIAVIAMLIGKRALTSTANSADFEAAIRAVVPDFAGLD